jgi:TolB-like protein/Tfp pilus assembly protein PilF
MNALLSELRRRHVFKVAAAYGVVAWLVIQAASIAFPAFGAPDWALRVVIALAVLGFPVALVLAWAYELTPGGVRRATPPGRRSGPPNGRGRRSLDSRAAGWLGVGIVVGLTTVGTYGWTRLPNRTGAEPDDVRSVAVLPFASVGADPADEYFSEGISEEILNALSQVPGLRVAARTSAFSFKGADVGIDSIARSLRVAHILEGSVRTAGGRVRITARLVDAQSANPVWSHSYDREAKDVLAVQEEIAAAIANALEVELAGGERPLARSRTADPEAYELYLQGRHLANKRTKGDLTQAIGRFEAALQRDPAFAAAYSGLADAYALLDDYGGLPREEAYPKSIAAAKRALELDELQAEAHASLGHVYFHQRSWAAAEREYLRALELNPSYATAHHWYGLLLQATGRHDEAVRALERAYELDLLSPKIREVRGRALYYARQFDRAIAWYQEQMRGDPNDDASRLWLGRTFLSSGRYAEAMPTLQRVLDRVPADQSDAWARAQLAAAYAAAGRREEAARTLRELEGIAAEQGASHTMAIAYGYLGDRDRAFHWLDTAVERGSWMLGFLEVEPMFDPLRSDPRFADVVRRARLRGAAD